LLVDCCGASKENWRAKVNVAWLSEMESLLSEGGQNSFDGLHVYSVQGCDFFWATVIFRFAGTTLEKRGHEKGKITRNLGFYFGKSRKIY
jgi:hypothetical protein